MCPSDTQTATRRPASNKRTTGDSTPHAAPIAVLAMDDTWQTGSPMSTGSATMAFKNEVVSDADIDRYKLPFPKGEGRWWTRDVERDYYLWGGLVGNLAYEDEQEGWFYLYVDGVIYDVYIKPAPLARDAETNEAVFRWLRVTGIDPCPSGESMNEIIGILKEALACFGFDGRKSIYFPRYRVIFDF